jgi:hypothetical protein
MAEHDEQVALFAWAEYQTNIWPDLRLLYAIPNGAKLPWTRNAKGQRYSREAKRLKDEGLKPGVPDVCLPVARRGFHGLYVEMKYDDNKTSADQDVWLEALAGQGYKTAVCWSFEAARKVIEEYLGPPP